MTKPEVSVTVKYKATGKQRRMRVYASGSRFMVDGSAISPWRFNQYWGNFYNSYINPGHGSFGSSGTDCMSFDGYADFVNFDHPYYMIVPREPERIVFIRSVRKHLPSGGVGQAHAGAKLELVQQKFVPRQPNKPLYNPPRILRFGKPLVREWTKEGSMPESLKKARSRDLKKLDAWFAKVEASKARLFVYDLHWKQRKAAYDVKYKKFLEDVLAVSRPQFRPARSARTSRIKPDNPYKYLELIPFSNPVMGRLNVFGGTGFFRDIRNSGRRTYDPSDPATLLGLQSLAKYPWSNPFAGTPFEVPEPSNYESRRYDHGMLLWGLGVEHNEYYDGNASWDKPEVLEQLHADIFKAIDSYIVDVDNKLTRKIFSKLKRNVVHVGNLIGERKQTFDLMLTLYKRISSLVLLKKGILKAAGRAILNKKAWADDVLAFKFGVEPLVSDFLALQDHLSQIPDETPIITVRTNNGQMPRMVSFRKGGVEFNGSIEVSYVVKLTALSSSLESLKRFGLTNPMETAWELTPWSFVVDWVLPVGEWISSLTADAGLVFNTGTRKVKIKGVVKLYGPSGPNPDDPAYAKAGSQWVAGEFAIKAINRTVLTELPSRNRILSVKSPLSWAHGIESLALLIQRLK